MSALPHNQTPEAKRNPRHEHGFRRESRPTQNRGGRGWSLPGRPEVLVEPAGGQHGVERKTGRHRARSDNAPAHRTGMVLGAPKASRPSTGTAVIAAVRAADPTNPAKANPYHGVPAAYL